MATKGKVSPSPKEKKVMSSSSSSTPALKINSINQRKSPGTSKQTSPVKKRQDSSSSSSTTSPAKTRSIPNYLKPTISSGPQPHDHNNKLKKTSTNFSSSSSSNNSNSSNIGKLNFARRRSFDRPLPSTTPSSQSQKTRTSPTLKERRSSSFTTRSPLPHPDTRPPLKLTNKGLSSPAYSSQGRMTNKKKSEETGGATKEITKTNSNDLLNTGDEILNLDDQLQVDHLDLSSTSIITTSNDLLDIRDEILNIDHQLQDEHPNSSSTTIIDHQLHDENPNPSSSTITDHQLQDEHPNSSSTTTTITDNQLKDEHPDSSSTTITDHQLQDDHPNSSSSTITDHQLQDDQPNSSSTTIIDHQQVLDDVHDHDPDPNSTVITNSSTVEDMDVDRRDVINLVGQKQEKEEEKEKEVEVAGNHEVDEEVTVAESSFMGGDKQEPATNYNETENSHDRDVTTLSTQTMVENADEVILEQAEPKEENIAESAGPEEQEHEQEMVHKEGAENNEEESMEKAAEMEHVEVENEEEMKKKQQQQKQQQEIIQGKKESNSVSNDVIEETATKLREQRKNKVKALAGAFETVISLQDPK